MVVVEVVIMCMAFIWTIMGEFGVQLLLLTFQVVYFFGILLTSASAACQVTLSENILHTQTSMEMLRERR